MPFPVLPVLTVAAVAAFLFGTKKEAKAAETPQEKAEKEEQKQAAQTAVKAAKEKDWQKAVADAIASKNVKTMKSVASALDKAGKKGEADALRLAIKDLISEQERLAQEAKDKKKKSKPEQKAKPEKKAKAKPKAKVKEKPEPASKPKTKEQKSWIVKPGQRVEIRVKPEGRITLASLRQQIEGLPDVAGVKIQGESVVFTGANDDKEPFRIYADHLRTKFDPPVSGTIKQVVPIQKDPKKLPPEPAEEVSAAEKAERRAKKEQRKREAMSKKMEAEIAARRAKEAAQDAKDEEEPVSEPPPPPQPSPAQMQAQALVQALARAGYNSRWTSAEPRELVGDYQAANGMTEDDMYGIGTAKSLWEIYGHIPPNPFYYPATNTNARIAEYKEFLRGIAKKRPDAASTIEKLIATVGA